MFHLLKFISLFFLILLSFTLGALFFLFRFSVADFRKGCRLLDKFTHYTKLFNL